MIYQTAEKSKVKWGGRLRSRVTDIIRKRQKQDGGPARTERKLCKVRQGQKKLDRRGWGWWGGVTEMSGRSPRRPGCSNRIGFSRGCRISCRYIRCDHYQRPTARCWIRGFVHWSYNETLHSTFYDLIRRTRPQQKRSFTVFIALIDKNLQHKKYPHLCLFIKSNGDFQTVAPRWK